MKRITILALLLGTSLLLSAQEREISTLEVTGKAAMSVMPDEAIFSLTVNQHNSDFGEALDQLNTKISAIKSQLKKVEIADEGIKTVNYSINENWKYENGKRYRDGYKAVHSMNVHLPFKKEKMKEVYAAIRKAKVDVNMQLRFSVSDQKKYENKLMQKAMRDAKVKAEVLTAAADVQIVGIQRITYGGPVNNYSPRNYGYEMDAMMQSKSGANIDVTPGTIQLQDQVFVVFEIQSK